jgi:hypothetical protein
MINNPIATTRTGYSVCYDFCQYLAQSLRRLDAFALGLALSLYGFSAGLILAQTPSDQDVKKSIDDQSFPWYDAQTEAEKPVTIVADPDETGQRDSNWLGSGTWQKGTTTRRVGRVTGGWFSTAIQVLFWTFVAAMLLGLSYVVIVAFMKMDAKLARQEGSEIEDEEEDKTRIENLPFQVKRATSDLLGEARACYDRGEYNDAIIYLYSHQLIELDRSQAIHLTKGKTNRQYLRELRERPNLGNILESSVLLFEEAFFGHHTITRHQIDRCWNRLPEFQKELEQVTA